MAGGSHTGYIHRMLDEGQDFPAFVWSVARGFGAFVSLRDSSEEEVPTPLQLEPNPYYAEEIRKAEFELAEWNALSEEERLTRGAVAVSERIQDLQRRIAEEEANRSKVTEMLESVSAWVPPTAGHEGLRYAMLGQLRGDLRNYDDGYWRKELAKEEATTDVQAAAQLLARIEWDLGYYAKALAEEKARVADRNAWIASLNASVPKPPAKEAMPSAS